MLLQVLPSSRAATLPVILLFPFSQMPRAAHRAGGKQLVGPIIADNPFLHWVPPELPSEYNRYVAQMAQGIRTDRHINWGHRALSGPDSVQEVLEVVVANR